MTQTSINVLELICVLKDLIFVQILNLLLMYLIKHVQLITNFVKVEYALSTVKKKKARF